MATMTAEALSLATIFNAAKPTTWDLGFGQVAVRFALIPVGKALVFLGSWVLRALNRRLERDAFTLRGLYTAVLELDASCGMDKDGEGVQLLQRVDKKVLELQGWASEIKGDRYLKSLHAEARTAVERCATLHVAIVELVAAIVAHDEIARTGNESLNTINSSFDDFLGSVAQGAKPNADAEMRARALAATKLRNVRPNNDWSRALSADVKDAND